MFKELGEEVRTIRPKRKCHRETQPGVKFLESRLKEILFNEAHDQVGIGGGHSYAYGSSLYLEVMLGVEGEVVVGKNKLGKLDKELSG